MKTVILCYHKIGSEELEGRWLNCDPKKLGSHARYFARKQFPGFLPQDFSVRRPEGICFTFDDAYVSAVANAPAVLEASGYRGAFYAVPSLVGDRSNWDGDLAVPLATWGELHDLARRGHEIGNHTMTHARLAELSLESQMRELQQAHDKLVELGFEPKSVCYPYGSFDSKTLHAMESLGYRVGLKLGKAPVSTEDARELNRIIVAFSDNVPKLLYKIHIRPKLR